MTPRQEAFVREYLVDLCAAKAAMRAGYRGSTVRKTASELLAKPKIQAAIEKAMRERSHRTQITSDRILEEVGRIALFDIRRLFKEDGSLKKPHELDDDAAAVLSSVETLHLGSDDSLVVTKKAKVFDKTAALTLAMRHLGMLNDKLQLTGVQVIVKDYTGRKPAPDADD